jgi:hypothetical protein
MENLPRNLGREISRVKLPKARRQKRSWTLLLVRENGNVISFKGFKGLVVGLLLLLGSSLAADVGLFYLMRRSAQERDALQMMVDREKARLMQFREERQALMQQLAAKDELLERQPALPVDSDPGPANPWVQAGNDLPAVPVDAAAGAGDRGSDGVPPEDTAADAPPAAAPALSVDNTAVIIDEFTIERPQDGDALKVHFVIRNRHQEKGAVSGRTFLVLKKNIDDQQSWTTIPRTELTAGVPASAGNGQFFSISFFKPVEFTIGPIEKPEELTRATVFVFGTDGELLHRQDFPLSIPMG